MKKYLHVQFTIFVWICFYCATVSGMEDQYHLELKDLLPQAGDADCWYPEGEAQFVEGEDLFLLINGGADIYHEYGFREAAFQTYSTEDGKSINLEIYKMDSHYAAYGVYTFKTGVNGDPFEIGHEGWFESYYLNFWKGCFQVTITSLDTDSATRDGIEKIAEAIDSKLKFDSKQPHIISYLPKENLQANGITYLRGNLALFNQYLFDSENIFGLKEGVVGKYDGYSIFIFQYVDQNESKKWYEFAKKHLKSSERFDNFADRDAQFEITDQRKNILSISNYQKWIVIIMGNKKLVEELKYLRLF